MAVPDASTAAGPLDDVVAAVAVLRDPGLPGAPWSVAQIAAVLPLLADGPSGVATEAWGARMLAAVDETGQGVSPSQCQMGAIGFPAGGP